MIIVRWCFSCVLQTDSTSDIVVFTRPCSNLKSSTLSVTNNSNKQKQNNSFMNIILTSWWINNLLPRMFTNVSLTRKLNFCVFINGTRFIFIDIFYILIRFLLNSVHSRIFCAFFGGGVSIYTVCTRMEPRALHNQARDIHVS